MVDNPKCIRCGSKDLDIEPLYYDALSSGVVEAWRFKCNSCGIIFEVKE